MKKYLFAPGPTAVPPEVLLAMANPIIHHRSADFVALFDRVVTGLKWLFQTESAPLVLASSGTGAMEAAVSNFLSPGDKALVVNGGKFGERWGLICNSLGVKVEEIKLEWGTAVDPAEIEQRLKDNPSIKAVYIQASETSTGVSHDTEAIAAIVRGHNNTILVVDAITALGVQNLKTDQWGLDILLTGSQKALMLPPGLAIMSVSEKAWALAETCRNSHYYFNLLKERKAVAKNQTVYTPAVSLIVGLDKVLEIMREEGLDALFQRHARLARATREGIKGMGLSLYPRDSFSDALTAICSPEGIDAQQVYKELRDKYGITCAGGQDHAKGKIFRVAHMGYSDTFDVITVLSAIEMVLKGMGVKIELGSGVKIAQEILMNN